MRVTALGHAGLRVQSQQSDIVVDPWFAPEGAFLGSWFPFPDNLHLATPELTRPSAVVVTHEHFDHIDAWWLAQVDPGVPVVVPRYPSTVLQRKLQGAGRTEIVELDPWERFTVGDATLFFVAEASPMNHDAALVVSAGGATLLDLNDARLFPMQLRRIKHEVGGHIDALALQGAGASWYPLVYDYPSDRKAAIAAEKRLAKLNYVARTAEIIEPTIVLPFAGPPCFLDPELFAFNDEMTDGIFPDQQQVACWLRAQQRENVEVLLPGETWDCTRGRRVGDDRWASFWEGDRGQYLRAYAERRRPHIASLKERYPEPDNLVHADFDEYFSSLLAMSAYFNARIAMRVGFDITGRGGGQWWVDFRPGREGTGYGLDDCGYVIRLASRWLPPILAGELPWEDFFLSLRFEAHRDPDLYNDHLLGLLKFACVEALDAVQDYEETIDSSEQISITAGDETYVVKRYCPHAGSDLLETGEVLPGGVFQRLVHHYQFDLATGECLNGRCEPLAVRTIGRGAVRG